MATTHATTHGSPEGPAEAGPNRHTSEALFAALTLACMALITYGSLFPLADWRHPGDSIFAFLVPTQSRQFYYSDVVLNVLAYVPLGLCLALALRLRLRLAVLLTLATATGTLLSFTMETLQMFLPSRVSSLADLATNTFGAFAGGVAGWALGTHNPLTVRLGHWREYWFTTGTTSQLALLAAGLWVAAQLAPGVPSLDVGNLRQGLAPLLSAVTGKAAFAPSAAITYAAYVGALGALLFSIARPHRRWLPAFAVAVAAVLALKVIMVGRQLSAEALTGSLVGVAIAALLAWMPVKARALLGAGLVGTGFLSAALIAAPSGEGQLYPFNWVPFQGHVRGLTGIAALLEGVWPFLAAGCLVRLYTRRLHLRLLLAIAGFFLAVLMATVAEVRQTGLPGRYADITDILLALIGWSAAWYRIGGGTAQRRAAPDRHRSHGRPPAAIMAGTGLAVLAGLGAITLWGTSGSSPGQAPAGVPEEVSMLPEPAALPPADLPEFRYRHPRLPAPSREDLAQLRAQNPGFLERHAQRADGGGGDFYSVILTAYVDPGSQDLARLHRRLMNLEFQWRGHEQAKPMALAYDWLYAQWTERQRMALQEKLLAGAEYLIRRIREHRLSPYNVYLYNSPFQALVAATLALHGDHPRAEPVMRFTHDLWKHRVLPVWRQIMGTAGGWHEGGEYVGIGIGQAIYQVPAMWRSATGEDIFLEEPGLKGFLDFLVYRQRPDGTHFRWGDAGHFDRRVPDRIPLAIEYGHAAAYSLGRQPPFEPTAWPWGPLPRAYLYDPAAVERLPWARLFDGLGLVVARSDWSPDATYVTFKAGDNYWSHSHLDQGAFTIYKGGPLAIDSGLYGPKYGSDHHMNYTYQTIAHNVVTVTDPQDIVHAPPRKDNEPSRSIANDGGQRRVGSGWGVESAPIDLAEWHAKREIYETGDILHHDIAEDYLYVAADLTAAYTNPLSGQGTFSDRTRRVERYLRTFIYDRRSGAVIVYDRVSATEPNFRKRWLLHTVERPVIRRAGFDVSIGPEESSGRTGGRMSGEVLLPEDPNVFAIGGPGFEFFIGDRNYDAGGQVQRIVEEGERDVEPGAWRIEVSPGIAQPETRFLAVMFPRLDGAEGQPEVRRIDEPGRVGVELRTAGGGTTRWWLIDDPEEGVRVRVARNP